jgi:hypothetical protein
MMDKQPPADRQRGPPPYGVAARERHRTAASTIHAFWWVVGLRDQERFKAWLADHPYDAPFLLKLLESK